MTEQRRAEPLTAEEPVFLPVDLTWLVIHGVLMAANERFFWPLGLALTWSKDDAGSMSGLHVREWTWDDGHHERIDLDPEDDVGTERRRAFEEWLVARAETMPTEERSLLATPDPRVEQLEAALEEAIGIIELADNRAMAADGPVSRTADEMSDKEWRQMYFALERARALLRSPQERSGE